MFIQEQILDGMAPLRALNDKSTYSSAADHGPRFLTTYMLSSDNHNRPLDSDDHLRQIASNTMAHNLYRKITGLVAEKGMNGHPTFRVVQKC